MNIGTQLVAPEGLGSLIKNQIYYLLLNQKGLVALASFKSTGEPRAYLTRLPASEFEAALLDGSLVPADQQHTMPPWLLPKEGRNLSDDDLVRKSHKKAYSDYVNKRYAYLHDLLDRADEILLDEHARQRITQHAATFPQKPNPTRLFCWFLSYLAFGTIWALLPPFFRSGQWDRAKSKHAKQKMGRPATERGRQRGYSAIPLADAIAKSFQKIAKLGVRLTTIYDEAMRKHFGCKVGTDDQGIKYFYHPDSKPFPTFGQYRYWTTKTFGLAEVHQTLYGAHRVRTKSETSEGSFAESVNSILEKLESDVYQVKEQPLYVNSRDVAPPLKVAVAVDLATGRKVGIGFSLGGERADAYRLAQFSMCMEGENFGKIIGLPLTKEQWPGIGISRHSTTDRGPGASKKVFGDVEDPIPIREITPSYMGQSKAAVESSHPRSTHSEGPPVYKVSNLNYARMMQREVFQAIMDNETSDASSRMTPEMVAAGVKPTPIGIWNFLVSLGRTSARPMAFANAVRAFLKPVEFSAQRDGLMLGTHRFDSKQLRATKVLDRIGRQGTFKVKGYIYDNAARYAWVEIKGELIEVCAMLPLRDDENQLYMSVEELEMQDATKRKNRRLHDSHRIAASAEIKDKFEEATGERWAGGSLKRGRKPTQHNQKPKLTVITGGRGQKGAK